MLFKLFNESFKEALQMSAKISIIVKCLVT